MLEDLQSANGSRRNGVAVAEGTTLRDGDELEFGAVKAIYHAAGASSKANPTLPSDLESDPAANASDDPQEFCAGAYRLEALLGEGPGYRAYRAMQSVLGQPVSLKLFENSLSFSPEDRAKLAQAVAQLHAHAHPNIVAPLALEIDGGRMFLASVWTAGASLLDALRRRHALPVQLALVLLQQAAAAWDHARECKLPPLDFNLRSVLLALAAAPASAD